MKGIERYLKTLAVCLMALAMVLAACSRGGQSSDSSPSPSPSPSPTTTQPAQSSPAQPETVTVKFTNFSASGDNEKVLQQMKEEFERQHPHIKV
ncbi:MAG TPA: hypothetical protein VIL22_00815 [Paenibacillaceae bacterium]